MVIRLKGEFGFTEHRALRDAFEWVTGPVTIDVREANLAANALGEIMLLANRIGPHNVRVVNPTPSMRKVFALTHFDRVLTVSGEFTCTPDSTLTSRR